MCYQCPTVGSRQCIVAGVCIAKTMRWSLGNTLHWVYYKRLVLYPKPCSAFRVCATLALRWGPRSALPLGFALPRPYSGAKAVGCFGCLNVPNHIEVIVDMAYGILSIALGVNVIFKLHRLCQQQLHPQSHGRDR